MDDEMIIIYIIISPHVPADVGDVRSRVALDLLGDEVQVHVSSHIHLPQVDL